MKTPSTYRLQIKSPGKGQRWQFFDCLPAATEEEAFELLTAWERYSPRDRWRWVRHTT